MLSPAIFNCPGMNWSTLYTQNDGVHDVFLDCVVSAGFSQCVDFSTRGRNTLDLVLTDNDQLVNSVVADDVFGDSDHDRPTVKFVIVLESTADQTPSQPMILDLSGPKQTSIS